MKVFSTKYDLELSNKRKQRRWVRRFRSVILRLSWWRLTVVTQHPHHLNRSRTLMPSANDRENFALVKWRRMLLVCWASSRSVFRGGSIWNKFSPLLQHEVAPLQRLREGQLQETNVKELKHRGQLALFERGQYQGKFASSFSGVAFPLGQEAHKPKNLWPMVHFFHATSSDVKNVLLLFPMQNLRDHDPIFVDLMTAIVGIYRFWEKFRWWNAF